jgi:signal transduction histidine kinase
MQQIPENDPRQVLLQKIYRQTSRRLDSPTNLLNFSRVSDSRFVAIDLNRALDDTIQLLEALPIRTTRRLRSSSATVRTCPRLPATRRKLQQVFMNLILNARDAMPRGGQLEISTGFE